MNSKEKWLALSNTINETCCEIICLQETKREHIDSNLVRKFCPKRINKFDYHPFNGASGGLLVAWNITLFHGVKVFEKKNALSIQFTSNLNGNCWIVSNIYGPCQLNERAEFLDWFQNIQMDDSTDWMVLGDFYIIRYPDKRNKDGGNLNEMMNFNAAIGELGLVEIPMKGRNFTWSNMQEAPCWKKLIGGSLQSLGHLITPTLLLHVWQNLSQIMCHISFKWAQTSQNQTSSDLRSTGYSCQTSKK